MKSVTYQIEDSFFCRNELSFGEFYHHVKTQSIMTPLTRKIEKNTLKFKFSRNAKYWPYKFISIYDLRRMFYELIYNEEISPYLEEKREKN